MLCKKHLPLRGNHTQNFVESQFRVMKDEISDRVQSYNPVELIGLVTKELEDHYIGKLLSVANGSFDGVFGSRFFKSKHLKDVKLDTITVIDADKGIYKALPSSKAQSTNPQKTEPYIVDTKVGFCTCHVGKDGSLCKHQFAVLKKFGLGSVNALPHFGAQERQKYAVVATGRSLPFEYYLGLQEKAEDITENTSSNISDVSYYEENMEHVIDCKLPDFAEVHSIEVGKEDAQQALDDIYKTLQQCISEGNPLILSGIVKVKRKLERQTRAQMGRALHCFGNKFTSINAKKRNEKSKLRKGSISVGVEAVSRRKKGQVKSKKALPKGPLGHFSLKDKTNYSKKREHNFSHNVAENVIVARKAGRSMDSKAKPILKEKAFVQTKWCIMKDTRL